MYRMKLNPVLLGPKVFIVEHVSLQYLVCYSFRQECMNPKHPRSRSLEFADDTHTSHSATLYLDIPTRHCGHSPTCCPTPHPPPLPGEGYKTQFYTRAITKLQYSGREQKYNSKNTTMYRSRRSYSLSFSLSKYVLFILCFFHLTETPLIGTSFGESSNK